MIWLNLLLFAVSFIGLSLLSPKPKTEKLRPQEIDDLSFPQASDGSPIAFAFGRVRHRGPNTIWYGDFESKANVKKVKTGILSSEKVTTGFRYYIGVALGLGLGPGVKVRKIWIDKDIVWEGTAGPSPTLIAIDKPDLFGGKESGGGFVGNLRFYGGEFGQALNSYMAGVIAAQPDPPASIPAYRGQSYLVLEKPNIGNAAQLRPMSFELELYTTSLGLASEVNVINDDLNPVEALYHILVDDWKGVGIDPAQIDTASFTSAAAVLADEENGMSLCITSPSPARDLAGEILRQIDGTVYQDPATGKFVLKLIRPDYDVDDLPIFDETNVVAVRNFSRMLWSETSNEVRVSFNDRENGYNTATSLAQDMSNINAQGRLRSQTVSFPGCTSADLAAALAARELAQASVPLFKVTLELNREGIGLRPGDVFVFAWANYNIESAVMRIQRINSGELADGRIVIEAVQDTFAAATVVFAAPGGSLAPRPVRAPSTILAANRAWIEAPYFIMAQQTLISPLTADSGWTMGLARRPSGQQGYSLLVDSDSGFAAPSTEVDRIDYTESALLDASIGATTGKATGSLNVTIELVDGEVSAEFLTTRTDGEARNGQSLFLIGAELFAYTTVTDNLDGTYTLAARRALLDTEFAAHTAGDAVFFMTSSSGLGLSTWPETDALFGKFQSFTDRGSFDISGEATISLTLAQRYDRPAPPDLPTFGGSATPGTITTTGPHTVAWFQRNRTDAAIAWEDDASDTPEASQTYRVEAWVGGVENVGLRQTGVSGTSTTITLGSPTSGAGEIRIYAERSGLLSGTPARVFPTFAVP